MQSDNSIQEKFSQTLSDRKLVFLFFGSHWFRKNFLRFSPIENLFSCFWITVIQENFAQILSDWKLVSCFFLLFWINLFRIFLIKFESVVNFLQNYFASSKECFHLNFLLIAKENMNIYISYSFFWSQWNLKFHMLQTNLLNLLSMVIRVEANYMCWISNSQNFRLLHDVRVCQNRPCALEHYLFWLSKSTQAGL